MEIKRQSGIGLFSFFKNENIRFEKENTFDPHIEIIKKVDTLIALNENETWSEEPEIVTKLKNNYWE